MKKILGILGIIIAAMAIYVFVSEDFDTEKNTAKSPSEITAAPAEPSPAPTLTPEWKSMSYEEKIIYYNDVLFQHITETDIEHKEKPTYSADYCLLLMNTIRQEARDKYDIAFKKKTRINAEYLLFDFDTNEFMLMYESKYGRHYGRFEGTKDSDWKLVNIYNDFMIDESRLRNLNGKLYYISEKEQNDSGYKKCDIEEPLKYILAR